MLDHGTLEADAHAIGFLGNAILRFHERAAAGLAEVIVLRSPDDAYRTAAIVEGLRQLAFVDGGDARPRERQHVASGELAAVEAADAGARVGGQAAHEGRQLETARHREIGRARPVDHAHAQRLAALQEMAAIRLDRLGRRIGPVDQLGRKRAHERHAHAVGLDQQVRTHDADLEAAVFAGLRPARWRGRGRSGPSRRRWACPAP